MSKYPNTKKLIMEKSLDLFSRLGYEGTSIRNIAGEVGVRESAIYNHYKSKEEILKAIVKEFKSNAAGTNILTEELLDEIDKPLLFMKNFSAKLIEQWNSDEERKFFRLLVMEQFRETEGINLSVTEYFNETRTVWEMIFKQMIKHKLIKKEDPKILAAEFIAPLYFMRMEYLVSKDKSGLDRIMRSVNKHVDFFWSAVAHK